MGIIVELLRESVISLHILVRSHGYQKAFVTFDYLQKHTCRTQLSACSSMHTLLTLYNIKGRSALLFACNEASRLWLIVLFVIFNHILVITRLHLEYHAQQLSLATTPNRDRGCQRKLLIRDHGVLIGI